MAAIGLDFKLGIERERIDGDVMTVAVIDMNAFRRHLHAEIRIAYRGGERGDLFGVIRKRPLRMQRRQIGGNALGQRLRFARGTFFDREDSLRVVHGQGSCLPYLQLCLALLNETERSGTCLDLYSSVEEGESSAESH